MGFSDAATVSPPSVSLSFSGVFAVILLIVGVAILYYVIRTAVRNGMLAAWRIRNRAEKEARDDQAQGW